MLFTREKYTKGPGAVLASPPALVSALSLAWPAEAELSLSAGVAPALAMASASLLLRFLDLAPSLLSPAEGGGPALGGGVPAGGGLPSSTMDSGPYPVQSKT